eukprot:6213463-Pleurochrysis_carterae.AAC.1
MHTCRFCARRMCTWRALALCALSFQSTSAWPTSPSPAPLTGDCPQARPVPAPAIAPLPVLVDTFINKYFPPRLDGSNSSKVPK